jgi:hypothetical protein
LRRRAVLDWLQISGQTSVQVWVFEIRGDPGSRNTHVDMLFSWVACYHPQKKSCCLGFRKLICKYM